MNVLAWLYREGLFANPPWLEQLNIWQQQFPICKLKLSDCTPGSQVTVNTVLHLTYVQSWLSAYRLHM